MAIRARIKSKLKSLLFGSSASASQNAVQSSPAPQTTFVPPSVSTAATSSSSVTKDKNTTEAAQKTDDQPAQEEIEVEGSVDLSTGHDVATQTSDEANADAQDTAESSSITEADIEGASFIFEVTELFPATCPHCGAGSQNNWIRIENKFACGSCEAAY